jgi:hypothetical protein
MIWLHFCGGNYTPDKFAKEAIRSGITRRLPWHQAKRMEFGDKVIQAYWNEGHPLAFCEWVITGVCTDAFIADIAAVELGATDTGADPTHIERECGEFDIAGAFSVTESMSTVVDTVHGISQELGVKTWIMVSGRLTAEYEEPYYFDPDDRPFVRGFVAMGESNEEVAPEGLLLQIGGYKKA